MCLTSYEILSWETKDIERTDILDGVLLARKIILGLQEWHQDCTRKGCIQIEVCWERCIYPLDRADPPVDALISEWVQRRMISDAL